MINEETIFDRQLRPIVEREIMSQPAADQGMRVTPSAAADPRQLAAELKQRINPAYAETLGTESYERRLCAEAIELLLAQRDDHKERIEWMRNRITYLEHRNCDGALCAQVKTGQYWPQCEGEAPADPDMIGLTLIEYIDAQIALEAAAEVMKGRT